MDCYINFHPVRQAICLMIPGGGIKKHEEGGYSELLKNQKLIKILNMLCNKKNTYNE